MPPTKPTAQRTECAARGYFIHDDGIGILVFDAVFDTHLFKKRGQDRGGEIGLTLIEVAGDQFDGQKTAPLELVQDGQQGVAIFSPGHANQPFAAGFDHPVLLNRLARLSHKTFAQFAKLGALGGTVEERVNIFGMIKHGLGLVQLSLPIKRQCMCMAAIGDVEKGEKRKG